MKKFLITLCFSLLSLCLFARPAKADIIIYNEDGSINRIQESPKTAKWTYIWVAYPSDYVGEHNVYLHSLNNPEGVSIHELDYTMQMDTYKSSTWNYVCYRVCDLSPSEYWVSLVSDYDDFAGKGLPDTNFRSLLPNTNKNYPRIIIEADGDRNEPGSRIYNTQQFFCIYSRADELEENLDNMDSLFTEMMRAQVEYCANAYGSEYLVDNAFMVTIPGHYDDYVTLFQPYDCPLYGFFERAQDSPMHGLIPGFCSRNGDIFDIMNYPEEDTLYLSCVDHILYQSTLFGWDLVFDTRNLEYQETNWGKECLTEFYIDEDNTLVNIFFKNLDENVPKMEKPLEIDVNNKEELLKFLKTAPAQFEGEEAEEFVIDGLEDAFEEIDFGEESFNTVPDYESVPEPVPTPSEPTKEAPSFNWLKFIPIIIIFAIVMVAVVIFVSKRKKK